MSLCRLTCVVTVAIMLAATAAGLPTAYGQCDCGCGLKNCPGPGKCPNNCGKPPAEQPKAQPQQPKPKAQPQQQSLRLSVMGKADGATTDHSTFPDTTNAEGTMDYNVMGSRAVRKIQTEWEAKPVGPAVRDPQNAAYTTQEWEFYPKGDNGNVSGTARVTIKGGANGATGTATGWTVRSPDGKESKITFGVQFDGDKLQLVDFAHVVPRKQ